MGGLTRALVASGAFLCLYSAATVGQAADAPDPDSPAGVEYQLPLERARDDAGGGAANAPKRRERTGGSLAQRRSGAPLFGVGVHAANTAGDRGQPRTEKAQATSKTGDSPKGEPAPPAPSRTRETDGDLPFGTRGAASAVGDGSSFWLIAVVGGIVLVGGAVGLTVRRGLGRRP